MSRPHRTSTHDDPSWWRSQSHTLHGTGIYTDQAITTWCDPWRLGHVRSGCPGHPRPLDGTKHHTTPSFVTAGWILGGGTPRLAILLLLPIPLHSSLQPRRAAPLQPSPSARLQRTTKTRHTRARWVRDAPGFNPWLRALILKGVTCDTGALNVTFCPPSLGLQGGRARTGTVGKREGNHTGHQSKAHGFGTIWKTYKIYDCPIHITS